MARFIVVPQWQGSSSSRAMRLIDGALAIAGDLPRTATTILEVPTEAGEDLGSGVRRFSSLTRIAELVSRAVADGDGPAVVVGGDCGVALPSLAALDTSDVTVLWLDAHADLQTPATSPSGAFHGMVVRALLGDAPAGLALDPPLPASRVLLAGTREFDAEEEDFAPASGITLLGPDALADPEAVVEAVAATGASRVYIHVDLDVLDPGLISGVSHPVPFGATVEQVVGTIRAVRARLPLAGATLTEFSPTEPEVAVDDLGTILRIVGALA
ncbi:arginase family protein [Microbacterium sp. CCNWLW134]|uniref:arginase family protein n=1 Tax=Microbacterium sp. CCNWLW134 TaxID=3122064 RepID=UPI0030101602